MKFRWNFRLTVAALCLGSSGLQAAEPTPNLPSEEVVARVLRASPMVAAARGQIDVEEAQRRRLEAGPHEWSVRFGGQQRRAQPAGSPNERFTEWNAALERPIRLPGKSSLDSRIGAVGVDIAQTGLGDALHEASRSLLKGWFDWLRETVTAQQWQQQVELLGQQAHAVGRRQALGDAARVESVQATAALAQAESQLTLARVRQQNAAEDLRRRFPGLPLDTPAPIAPPQAIEGDAQTWVEAILEHNHELMIAQGETARARLLADRSRSDRLPDPTLGVHYGRERGGEENIVGAYISIPLPGGARRASSDAAMAEAGVASQREAAIRQRLGAEAANLYTSAQSGIESWQAAQRAADQLTRSADMTSRGYQLGEGSLNDLLAARRFANDAQLTARLLQLDALYLRYRLLLDTHRLWDLD